MLAVPYRTPPPLSEEPLVSIFIFCLNGAKSIRRAADSILKQPYRNVEFVVQDGLSTDGTLEILRGYNDDRIKIVSEKDKCPGDAMFRVLRRCRGELIGCCLSDEEFLPNAIVEAVEYFKKNPEAGALQRDWLVTDLQGHIYDSGQGGAWSPVDYLAQYYVQHIGSAFFRTAAFHDVGLLTHDWAWDCAEYEVWARFGDKYRIDYVPGVNVKAAVGHDGQLSNPTTLPTHVGRGWARMVYNFYKESWLLQGDEGLRNYIGVGMLKCIAGSPLAKNSQDKLAELVRYYQEELGLGRPIVASLDLCRKLHIAGKSDLSISLVQQVLQQDPHQWEAYHLLARLLVERGIFDQAFPFWEKARRSGDRDEHLRYLRARVQSPRGEAPQLLEKQREWAVDLPVPALPVWTAPTPAPSGKLRLGVHAADWSRQEVRLQLAPLLRELDRSRFELFCYGTGGEGIPEGEFHPTGTLDDGAFAGLARSHGLDVLVETSGMRPGHRWAALAARCARVQASYLGHCATTGVPNVDYLLADVATFPEGEEAHALERVARVPGCLTAFDLGGEVPTASPWESTGWMTFGCLEAGPCLNQEVLNLWITLLGSVPQSRLLLCNEEVHLGDVHNHIRAQFEKYRIARNRLLVFSRRDEALAANLHAQIDIALDPFPANGTVGTALALARGVPVVALRGNRFASRMGASLLAAAGLPELAAATPRDYLAQAAALARDPERLRRLRAELPAQARAHGLTDLPGFARRWEGAVAAMAGR